MKDSEVLNANDNLFQLAFRMDPVWSYVAKVFDKWETCEIKGQKMKDTKKPKKKEGGADGKAPYEDMKLTEWRLMQPLKDLEEVIPMLQRVLNKELSLSEMGQEFKRLKFMCVVQRAFVNSLIEDSWTACKNKYTQHCTDEILLNFVPLFTTWVRICLDKLNYCKSFQLSKIVLLTKFTNNLLNDLCRKKKSQRRRRARIRTKREIWCPIRTSSVLTFVRRRHGSRWLHRTSRYLRRIP